MDEAAEILRQARTIAVVGLSSDQHRPSYRVSAYLQRVGYLIIPVNPTESSVLGERAYPRLEDIPDPVDVVCVFRRPEFLPEIVESAIRIRAKALWLQEGIEHPAAAARARAAGLLVVENRCMYKEHLRLRRAARRA
jgi:predicted CoA-binding protein